MRRLTWLAAAIFVVGCGDDGGSTGPDDAASTDDSAPGDAALDDALPDDAALDDSAPPGDAALGTTCGTATCTATQECCVGAGGRECVDLGACQGVALACDGDEDCGSNEVCCAGGGGGGPAAGGTECRNANQCNANVCRAMTDCEGNDMCCSIQQLGISLCLAQCPP